MIATPTIVNAVNKAYSAFKLTYVGDCGQAPFVTGNLRKDAFMHWLTEEWGIHVIYSWDQMTPKMDIVDEKKYSMFVLKWS